MTFGNVRGKIVPLQNYKTLNSGEDLKSLENEQQYRYSNSMNVNLFKYYLSVLPLSRGEHYSNPWFLHHLTSILPLSAECFLAGRQPVPALQSLGMTWPGI